MKTPVIIGSMPEKHLNALIKFAKFIGADEIKYVDSGKMEDYVIKKDEKTFLISIGGNQYDGGFANFYECDSDGKKIRQ